MQIERIDDLDVPSAIVWDILQDIEGWSVWSPTIIAARALDGPDLAPGHRFALRQPLQPETIWRITTVEPDRAFRWQTDRRIGFEAGHRIEPIGHGCRVQADLRPLGRTMPAIWSLLCPLFRRALAAEAEGLARAGRERVASTGGRIP